MINSIYTAEHYKWGADCDGWHLLQSPGLSLIQEKMPPDTGEVLHYHEKAQQVFYILDGVATFKLGEKTYTMIKGDSIHVPPGAVHQITNESSMPLSFLVISEPKAHGDRVVVEE